MTLTRNMPVEPQPLQLLLNKIKSPLKQSIRNLSIDGVFAICQLRDKNRNNEGITKGKFKLVLK